MGLTHSCRGICACGHHAVVHGYVTGRCLSCACREYVDDAPSLSDCLFALELSSHLITGVRNPDVVTALWLKHQAMRRLYELAEEASSCC